MECLCRVAAKVAFHSAIVARKTILSRNARQPIVHRLALLPLALGIFIGSIVSSTAAIAQSTHRNVPATKMVPIGPPIPRGPIPTGPLPSTSNPIPSSPGFGAPPPRFGTPRFGTSGPSLSASPLPGGFDPYSRAPQSNGFGANGFGANGLGANVTPIGPPVPVPGPHSPPIANNPVPNFGNGTGFGGGPSFNGGLFGGRFSQPASAPIFNGPVMNAPAYPGGYDNPNVYGMPSQGSTTFPSNPFPGAAFPSSSPSTLFPEGIFSGGGGFGSSPSGEVSAYRLLQGPRMRHSYVGFGDDRDDVNINDTDVSAILAFPNFLYSSQPLYVVPSFSLHLWDGPDFPGPVGTGNADLPGSAYSGFIDFGWNSDPNQIFSTEFGVRVGAFTDFKTFNSDSLRVLGKALASFRLTPTSTLKAGVYYLDRNKVKLLPAGGLLYQPNPYTRMDIFFPEPKLARYWRTVGTRDVWWYLAGDYGGGSWTIERKNGASDSIDLNDLRVMFGLEWGASDLIRAGRRSGFFEVGYVFEREVEYRHNPIDNLKPDDGVLFRLGIGY